jgi:hypothetical protein
MPSLSAIRPVKFCKIFVPLLMVLTFVAKSTDVGMARVQLYSAHKLNSCSGVRPFTPLHHAENLN